jgi:hypothetical protein
VRVVTSLSREGYDTYGKRFLETYHRHWKLPLVVYSEDDLPIPYRPLDDPDHLRFRANPDASQDYRFQAVRFSHKVFAILDAAQDGGRIVWLDADVVTFKDVPEKFIADLLPKGKHIAYLGRTHMHSECGFVIYDCDKLGAFFAEWRRLYTSGDIFGLKEWHDSYVFDHLRQKLNIPSENISGPGKAAHHQFINSPLGKYMDHLKGGRKGMLRSPRSDLVWERKEEYWA